jgi:hypothetical protein
MDPEKTRVTLRLLRYRLSERAVLPVEEKYRSVVEDALQKDSLQFVDYWSADFRYDGERFRPQLTHCRDAGGIADCCERLLSGEARVAVRLVDIFGNASFREVTKE